MKRKILSFLAAALLTTGAHAQLAQYHIGTQGHELATLVRPIGGNGHTIIAGYQYTINGASINNADFFVARLDGNANIVWQQRYGVDATNDLIQDMMITANGDIIIVGTVGRNNVFANNNAFIMRLDPNTGLANNAFYLRSTNNTTAGEYYTGVCELDNGNIVAVGAYAAAPGTSDGMVSVFDANLTPIYHERVVMDASQTDAFQSVVASGDRVYISGYVAATTFHDVTVTHYTPGTTTGAVNWARRWAYAYNDQGTNLTNNFGGKLFLLGDRLVMNSGSLNDWSPANVTRGKHFVFRCDLAGNNAEVFLMSNTTQAYTNSSPIFPTTPDHMIYSQNPGPNQYDPALVGNAFGYDALVSDAISIGLSTFNFVRNMSQPGTQSVVDLVENNSNFYLAGGSSGHPGNLGGNDVYYIIGGQNFTDETGRCNLENMENGTRAITPQAGQVNPALVNVKTTLNMELTPVDPQMRTALVCGEPPVTNDCKSKCYWRIDGNDNIGPANFLGSINNADVRFRTNNNEVGVFETDGDFGINLNVGNPATAKLHVFCDLSEEKDLGHSNVRFEELMEGNGRILVIDDQGYVYKAGVEAFQSEAMTAMKEELATLKAELAQMKQMIGHEGGENKAGNFKISPNPSDGNIEVNYTLPANAQNASIRVTDMSGRVILTVPADTKSNRMKLTIPTEVSGNVICTLTADGKVIGTQKLVLATK